MSGYTKVNLKSEVEDKAPGFGMEGVEARFAREAMEVEQSGLSYFRFEPNAGPPFGHSHAEQEEVYVVVSGSARIKVEDEVIELGPFDALRVAPGQVRATSGGPEGCEMIAFGAPQTDQRADSELFPGWWER